MLIVRRPRLDWVRLKLAVRRAVVRHAMSEHWFIKGIALMDSLIHYIELLFHRIILLLNILIVLIFAKPYYQT